MNLESEHKEFLRLMMKAFMKYPTDNPMTILINAIDTPGVGSRSGKDGQYYSLHEINEGMRIKYDR